MTISGGIISTVDKKIQLGGFKYMKREKRVSKYIKEEYVIHFFALLLIGILCCINIGKLDYIAVLNDEFGYWGNAASIVGYDWKALIAETPYYSLGYSLWLVPILYIFPTPEIWYKIAILLNVLFLYGAYYFCYKLGKKFLGDKDTKLIAFISILVIIYPSNILYAQVAWSESLLYFLVWAVTYLIVKLDEKFSIISFFEVLLLLVYMYCVHTRNIGIVAVAIVCLIAVLIKHNKSAKVLIGLILVLAVGIWGIKEIKSYQIALFWGNSDLSNMNNIGLNSTTFATYYQRLFENMRLFIESLGGKLVYLLIGTGLTCIVAVVGVLKETVGNIRKKHIFSNYWISKFWCVGILGVMWASSSLQMLDWTSRKDIIVYSRYMEHAMGPLLLLGLIYLLRDTKMFRKTMILSAGLFFVGLRSVYLRICGAEGFFNTICSPVMGTFYDNISSPQKAFNVMGEIVGLLFVVLFCCSFMKNRKNKNIIIVVTFMIIYIIIGYESSTYMNQARSYFTSNTLPLRDEIVKHDDVRIIYIKDVDADIYSVNPKYLQFMIPERKIDVVDCIDDISMNEEAVLLLINPQDVDSIQYIEENIGAECIVSTSISRLYDMH